MLLRYAARWALPISALLFTFGCTASEDASEEPSTTAAPDFYVIVPSREVTFMFAIPDDPQLQGNEEMTRSFLEIAAKGLDTRAPAAIKAQVATVVTALRSWEPGVNGLDDPGTRAAVEDINAWLAANCGPPTGSVPSGTTPPGSTG